MHLWIQIPLLLALVGPPQSPQKGQTLKVFLLAGQSNMQGQAVVDLDHEQHYNGGRGTLVQVLREPEMKARFGHLRDDNGKWTEREDVWVSYRPRDGKWKTGNLSIGYAVYPGRHHFGPELELGRVLGEHFDEQVLLIKTAWGGASLARDFRPPSAGGTVGPYYEKMLAGYHEALAHLDEHFPGAAKLTPELAGFVWFQGWNDMVDKAATAEYEDNLVHLILDLRRELGVPDLPVVIAETGNCNNMDLREAQANAAKRPELAGRCAFVPTVQFRRPADESPNTGHGHHWFGNAASYLQIGEAMGLALVEFWAADAAQSDR